MPLQQTDLFALSAAAPEEGFFHGGASFKGSAQAGADFRRGIDLSAGFDLQGEVNAAIKDEGISAAINGGIGVQAGVALQAFFPIDLFSAAGAVARLRLQAEAAGFIRASLALSPAEFYRLLNEKIPPGPINRMMQVFLEEVAIEAGLWARASFSAQLLGEASFTGSLLPSHTAGPGFTFSLNYGIGWLYGTGFQFVANLGLADPRRLMDRLSNLLTEIMRQEVEQHLARLDPANRTPTRVANALFQILLPLASRAAFQIGFAVAEQAGAEQKEKAIHSLIETFLQQAQQQLLEAIVQMAVQELGDLMDLPDLFEALVQQEDREELIEEIDRLISALEELQSISFTETEPWTAALARSIAAMDELLDKDGVNIDLIDKGRRMLACLWSAAVLLNKMLSWAGDPLRGFRDLIGEEPVPDGGSVAERIAGQIGKSNGLPLTTGDLLRFLLGLDIEQVLRNSAPEAAQILDVFGRIMGSREGEIVKKLLVDLAREGYGDPRQLLRALAAALSQGIHDEVIPKLLNPIKADNRDNVALLLFIDEVVIPTLLALPIVVLPNITDLQNPEKARRFREAISAVALQSMQHFLIGIIDVLLGHALREGQKAIRDAGQFIYEIGEKAPGFSVLLMAASRAFIPVSLTPKDVRDILLLSADVIHLWNEKYRRETLDNLRKLLACGLTTEETVALAKIMHSDAAVSDSDLQAFLNIITAGLWEVIKKAAPRLLELIALHFWNEAVTIGETVYKLAEAGVQAGKEAIKWLSKEAEELRKTLETLAQRATQLLAGLSSKINELANHLLTLVSQAIDAVRRAGVAVLVPLLNGLPEEVRKAFLDLFHALFDAAGQVLSLPLHILSSVSQWIADILSGQVKFTRIEESAVYDQIRHRILNFTAFNLEFNLQFGPFNLGKVVLPAGDMLQAIANIVLGDGLVRQTVHSLSVDSGNLLAIRTQEEIIRQGEAQNMDALQAKQVFGDLTPGRPLQVRITRPAPQSMHSGQSVFQVHIAGANRSFVERSLGIPPRVVLKINGQSYPFLPEHWQDNQDRIAYSAVLLVEESVPPAIPIRPADDKVDIVTRTADVLVRRTDILPVIQSGQWGALLQNPSIARSMLEPEASGETSDFARGTVGQELPLEVAGALSISQIPGAVSILGEAANFRPVSTIDTRQTFFDTTRRVDGLPVIPVKAGMNVIQVAASDGDQFRHSDSVVFFYQSETSATKPADEPNAGAQSSPTRFLLQTGTALAETDSSVEFLVAGNGDLFIIKKQNTGTHSTEVHILSATSNYQHFLLHTGTPLHETDDTFAFALAENRDLFVIKKRNTGSHSTEVHVLSAAGNYQQFILQTGTALHETDETFAFVLAANRDLFVIKKQNTGSRSTEVHVLLAASNYQQFTLHTGTALPETDETFAFVLAANRDLFVIKKRNAGTHATEVHVLSAVSNYQQFILQTGTVLPETDESFSFGITEDRNLVAIKKWNTGTRSTEVHWVALPDSLAPADQRKWRLNPGESLEIDQTLRSENGLYYLIMQRDGNLVLYDQYQQPVWATGTDGSGAVTCIMQADGNLVLYTPAGAPVWASHTHGNPDTLFTLQDDRNLVIYKPDGRPIWASGTHL